MENESKIRAILVDDEEDVLKNLSFLIGKFCSEVEIVGTAKSAAEAADLVQRIHPDLVFLDIAMPGKDGFDFLDQLSERNFELIFVTSYNDHAIRAFRYSALDYLLKPVDIEELTEAVNRVTQRIRDKQSSPLSLNLIKDVFSEKAPSKIAFPTSQGIHLVAIADILFIEADGSYCQIFVIDQKPLMISRNLKEYEDLLQEQGFFRVHNSYLVNLNHIKRYTQVDGGTIILANERTIPVSRRRKALFEQVLQRYLV